MGSECQYEQARKGERAVAKGQALSVVPAGLVALRTSDPSAEGAGLLSVVPAFDDAQSVTVLTSIATAHAAAARLEVAPVVTQHTHRLFKRFQPYAAFPGPAATFMRSLCERRTGAEHSLKHAVTASDAVITFKPLTLQEVEAITRNDLAELATREGFALAGIKLVWTDRIVALIAREGYDHRLGARPLQRAIERVIVTPPARWKAVHPQLRDVTVHLEIGEDGAVLVSPAPAVAL